MSNLTNAMATKQSTRTRSSKQDSKADQEPQQPPGAEVATAELRGEIERMKPEFAKALPPGLDPDQLVRDALTALRLTPKLAACPQVSVLGALMNCAQVGLRLMPKLNQASIVPRRLGGGLQAVFDIGYQGYITLGHRSPQVAHIDAREVHVNDPFSASYGGEGHLHHEPYLDGDPGAVRAYYAVVRYTHGGYQFLVMSRWQAERWRDAYAPRDRDNKITGPWADPKFFGPMSMKTCIRRLSKMLPLSDLHTAYALDGGVRLDLDRPAEEATVVQSSEGDDIIDGDLVASEGDESSPQPTQETPS